MYIKEITLENWKNFKKPGKKSLKHRLFLVGPNAAGKSNLLDAFRFLRDLCVSGGGLEKAVSMRGGVSAIRCLAASHQPNIIIEIVIGGDGDDEWRYRLSFGQDNLRKPIIKEEVAEHNGTILLKRPDKEDKKDSDRLRQTAIQQVNANKDFRDVATFLQSVSYQHLLPQVVRDPKGFSPGKVENDPFGRDLLQKVFNTPQKIRDSRLRKIQVALAVAAPQLRDLKMDRDNLGIPHLKGLYEHWRPNAGWQDESQFSDGTLRLFGLLWSLLEGDGPLLMEEPELSLHSEVVRHLPQLIERVNKQRKVKRQVIISTHSEEMLSDPGIGGEEILRLEPSPGGTLIISPMDSPEDRALLESGLAVSEVVLPKSAPKKHDQLSLAF